MILCSYTCETPVKHALWCTFHTSASDKPVLESSGSTFSEEPKGVVEPRIFNAQHLCHAWETLSHATVRSYCICCSANLLEILQICCIWVATCCYSLVTVAEKHCFHAVLPVSIDDSVTKLCGGVVACSIGNATSDPPICSILFVCYACLGMKLSVPNDFNVYLFSCLKF